MSDPRHGKDSAIHQQRNADAADADVPLSITRKRRSSTVVRHKPPVPGPASPKPRTTTTSRPPSNPVLPWPDPWTERYEALRARLDAEASALMAFWTTHGPDPEYGGFHGTLDRRGAPTKPTTKSLIQQSRHLWTLSMWHARRESTQDVKRLADDTYAFLTTHFLDTDGEFFHAVSRDGTVDDPKKQLYAQGFAIFALSEYAAAFQHQLAKQQALRCFKSIDARAHDDEFLGYDQSKDPGWLAPGAQKGTETHIHLLEAFTALYRLTGDRQVRGRLEELLSVIATRIVQPTGYAHREFLRDWTPYERAVVSYGHDLEAVWLVIDALDALKRVDPQLVRLMLRLGQNSAAWGWDQATGSFFEEGVPGGRTTKSEKIWWVQAEALASLWWLHRLSGNPAHLDQLDWTLRWIKTRQKDQRFGGWYWGLNPDGSVGSYGDHKGEAWHTSYHAVRALVFTSDWLSAAAR